MITVVMASPPGAPKIEALKKNPEITLTIDSTDLRKTLPQRNGCGNGRLKFRQNKPFIKSRAARQVKDIRRNPTLQ